MAGGRGEREERHAGPHHGGGGDLTASDVLVEPAHGDDEEEHDSRPDEGLDERERGFRERVRLQDPAGEGDGRARHPARPAEEAVEEREAKRALRRRLPRLEGLQPGADGIERSRAERGEDTDQGRRHDVERP